MRFQDRREGGRALARELAHLAGEDVLVLGLARGGVPVAFEIAQALDAPLDVFVVRKLGVPGHAELAMGAIAHGGVMYFNADVIDAMHVPDDAVQAVAERERAELARRERSYRGDKPFPALRGRAVVLVDDGLATGASMRAAAAAVRQQRPSRLIVAAPVGAPSTCAELRKHADEVVCAVTPEFFQAVGEWYADFEQTTDGEVRRLLDGAARRQAPRPLVLDR